MKNPLDINVKINNESMYLRVSGTVRGDELYKFENSLQVIETSFGQKNFTFDFSHLEEIPPVALSIIILMQMEARKKGKVLTIAPKNHLKTLLLIAGAIRSSELTQLLESEHLNQA